SAQNKGESGPLRACSLRQSRAPEKPQNGSTAPAEQKMLRLHPNNAGRARAARLVAKRFRRRANAIRNGPGACPTGAFPVESPQLLAELAAAAVGVRWS